MLSLPAVFLQKQRHFGLAVGRTSLRAVELEPSGKGKAAVEVMIPPETFTLDGNVNSELLTQALKKLLSVGKLSSHYVSVCFSEIYAFSRTVELPIMPYEDVREALSWKIKELFPFSESDVYYDWKLLERNEAGLSVSVIAVQKKIIDAITVAVLAVGLKPLSFQSTSTAIAAMLKLKRGQTVVLVEINKRGAYVTLLDGEKNIFTTVVNAAASDTPETYLSTINTAIKDMLEYYTHKNVIKAATVPIVFTGELATDAWAQKSTQILGTRVQILRTQLANPAFNKAFAVAAGVVAPPDDESTINLLPLHIQRRYDDEITESFYRSLFTRTCVLLFIGCALTVAAFVSIGIERQRYDSRVKQLTSVIDAQPSEKQHVLLLNAQAKSIVALAPLRKSIGDMLGTLAALIPQTVTITQWNFDDNKQQFTLKGEALDRSDLLQFKQNLENSSEFSHIILPLGSLESPKNVQFTINFDISKHENGK